MRIDDLVDLAGLARAAVANGIRTITGWGALTRIR